MLGGGKAGVTASVRKLASDRPNIPPARPTTHASEFRVVLVSFRLVQFERDSKRLTLDATLSPPESDLSLRFVE